MKLAFVNFPTARFDAVRGVTLRGHAAANIPLRTTSTRPLKARQNAGRLVAHWHVSPETGRIECCWSVDEAPADGSLCRRRANSTRRSRLNPPPAKRWGGKVRHHALRSDCRG
jgi:hypothetical protein